MTTSSETSHRRSETHRAGGLKRPITRDSGLLHTIRFDLAMETRELEGREAQPTAGVIDR